MKLNPVTESLPLKDITIDINNVHILGNGAWGTALSSLVSHTLPHPKTFVLVAPTNVLRDLLLKIKDQVDSETLIINASKGIESFTNKLPSEIVEEVLGKETNYFSLIGPSFAQEVVEKNPTIVNLGYCHEKYLAEARAIFETPYFEVVPTKCLKAIEMMSAFKNIYAIGCGMSEGLGYGVNTRTKLIILAYQELKRLLVSLKYEYDQTAQIAFLGDLVLTCSSTESRNFTFGKLLINSFVEKSLGEVGHTTEGLFSIASIGFFEQKAGVQLSLAKTIYDIINANVEGNNQNLTKKLFTDFILNLK